MSSLPFIAPTRFDDPAAALAQVRTIYDASISHLREHLQRFVAGESVGPHVRACYPLRAGAHRHRWRVPIRA